MERVLVELYKPLHSDECFVIVDRRYPILRSSVARKLGHEFLQGMRYLADVSGVVGLVIREHTNTCSPDNVCNCVYKNACEWGV